MPNVRSLRPVKRGRAEPGFTPCHRCRALVDNRELTLMALPGHRRGVWWGPCCAPPKKGDSDE